jgi:hypothetical protein
MNQYRLDIVFQPLGPELMIYDKGHDRVHILNETASLILQLYQAGHTFSDIEFEVRQRYSLNEERSICEDIGHFLDQMEEQKLI